MIIEIAKKLRSTVGELWLGEKLEEFFIGNTSSKVEAPIFIVGLPRSGSTLLYQILTEHYKLTYFSNFSSVFVSYPASISCLSQAFQKITRLKSYKSNYGITPGLFSPSESGGIYRYWSKLGEKKRSTKVKNTINKISSVYNRPFIWKNLNLSNEIEFLNEIFPNALFIKIERDLEYIVQSIFLKMRKGGKINVKGFETMIINEELRDNVICEAVRLDKIINEQLGREGIKSIHIKYEELCTNIEQNLKKIENSYTGAGYKMIRRKIAEIPNISVENKKRLENEEWNLMVEQIKKMKNENGIN